MLPPEKLAPCRGCGGQKPNGPGVVYCDACNAPEVAAERRRLADRDRKRNIAKNSSRYEKIRARDRAWRKGWVDSLSEQDREEIRARRRAQHEARREEINAMRRERYRQQQEQVNQRQRAYRAQVRAAEKGLRHLTVAPDPVERRAEPAEVEVPRAPRSWQVPARPLGDKLREMERTLPPPESDDEATVSGSLDVICERVGVAARSVWGWSNGERPRVDFYRAIDVLDKMDLAWWEVWTPETVRRPILTASLRGHKWCRGKRVSSTRLRTFTYGDGGPDTVEMAFVEAMFDATSDEEIAEAIETRAETLAERRLMEILPEVIPQAMRAAGRYGLLTARQVERVAA